MGWGALRDSVLRKHPSAVNLDLTQKRWYIRMHYSDIATHNPTTVQGHQILRSLGNHLTAETEKNKLTRCCCGSLRFLCSHSATRGTVR